MPVHYGTLSLKKTLRIDQVQQLAERLMKNDYRIYVKDKQQYNSLTKMINDLRRKDLADRWGNTMTMTITMIKKIIVSSGFNIFNTFINLYDQGFILNNRRPCIISYGYDDKNMTKNPNPKTLFILLKMF